MSQDWIKRRNGFQKRLDLDLDSAFCIDFALTNIDDNDGQ